MINIIPEKKSFQKIADKIMEKLDSIKDSAGNPLDKQILLEKEYIKSAIKDKEGDYKIFIGNSTKYSSKWLEDDFQKEFTQLNVHCGWSKKTKTAILWFNDNSFLTKEVIEQFKEWYDSHQEIENEVVSKELKKLENQINKYEIRQSVKQQKQPKTKPSKNKTWYVTNKISNTILQEYFLKIGLPQFLQE